MYSALQICCFLSISWKVQEDFLLRKAHRLCSCSISIISRIWNKECRVHLSCCVYHLMNFYSQGIRKSCCLFSASAYASYICMLLMLPYQVKQLQKWISIVHPSSPYTQIGATSTACQGKDTVWVENNMN